MIGIVEARDPASCKCRVRFPDLDNMVTDWLPVGQKKTLRDKEYWLPDEGEQVACMMDDNLEFGVIVCAIYSDADPPPVNSPDKCHKTFEDGTFIEYDRASHQLTVNVQGDVIVTAAGQVTVNSSGTQVNSDLHVNGNVTASGSVIDGGGNTSHHSH